MMEEDLDWKPVVVKLETELIINENDGDYCEASTGRTESPSIQDRTSDVLATSHDSRANNIPLTNGFMSSNEQDLPHITHQIKIENTEDECLTTGQFQFVGWHVSTAETEPSFVGGMKIKAEPIEGPQTIFNDVVAESSIEAALNKENEVRRYPRRQRKVKNYPDFVTDFSGEADSEVYSQAVNGDNSPVHNNTSTPRPDGIVIKLEDYSSQGNFNPEELSSELCSDDIDIKMEAGVESVSDQSEQPIEQSSPACISVDNASPGHFSSDRSAFPPEKHFPSTKQSPSLERHKVQSQKNAKRKKNPASIMAPFTCSVCSATFNLKISLKKHSLTHSDEHPFSCNQCAARFRSKSQATIHSFTHSDQDVKLLKEEFRCDQCSACFKQKFHLKRHLLTHSNVRAFSCNLCPAIFKSKGELSVHSVIHSDKRPFSCEECSMGFKRKNDLKEHLRTHTDDRPISCKQCPARFKAKRDLRLHLMYHSDVRRFSCDQCPARYRLKFELKEHLFSHTGERPYSCTECPSRFSRQSTLRKHLKIHSKARPFSCDLCSAQFKRHYSLNEHVSRVHSDEKPS